MYIENEKVFRWHYYFLRLAEATASLSKDPSTKVGAVLVRNDRTIISTGFNGFPRGIADRPERLNNREAKMGLTVHAEANAILAAAKHGIATAGATLYMVWHDVTSGIYNGGPPCSDCCLELIQAGVRRIVIYNASVPERWEASLLRSRGFLDEVGISLTELEPPEARL